jgi:hypothetical protein
MKKSNGVYFPEEVMLFLFYVYFIVKKKRKKKRKIKIPFLNFHITSQYLWIMTNGNADKTLLRNSASGSHSYFWQLNIYMQISFYIAI